jgi:CheY-like chemotaxis protein
MISKKTYGMCLLDIRIPLLDGKELYGWLKDEHPELANTTIFITGDVMSGDTQKFLNHTERPFLLKPFTLDELKKVAGKVLNESSNDE